MCIRDSSGILSKEGKDLQTLQAQYITADRITPDGLTAAATQVKSAGGNALVLQMKAPGGTLSWKSAVNEAAAYGVNGTNDLAETIQSLKSQDLYLVAVVSCCVDTLMAPFGNSPELVRAVKDTEQKMGREIIMIDTPIMNVSDSAEARKEAETTIKEAAARGSKFCLIHHSSCEQLVNKNLSQNPGYTQTI